MSFQSDWDGFFSNQVAAGTKQDLGNGSWVTKNADGTATYGDNAGRNFTFNQNTNQAHVGRNAPGLQDQWSKTYVTDTYAPGGAQQRTDPAATGFRVNADGTVTRNGISETAKPGEAYGDYTTRININNVKNAEARAYYRANPDAFLTAEISGLDIPYEVSDYVATHIKSSIRELEGALTKLSAFSKLSHTPITVEFAEQTLKDLISPDAKKEITPELIIQTVADHFNVKYDDLLSSKRTADIVHPRQIAMYLCRQMTTAPLQAVGKALGNRDHTTVIHGAEKIAQEVVKNDSMRNTIDIIIKKINPS